MQPVVADMLVCVACDVVDLIPELSAMAAQVAIACQDSLPLPAPCLAARVQCSRSLAVILHRQPAITTAFDAAAAPRIAVA